MPGVVANNNAPDEMICSRDPRRFGAGSRGDYVLPVLATRIPLELTCCLVRQLAHVQTPTFCVYGLVRPYGLRNAADEKKRKAEGSIFRFMTEQEPDKSQTLQIDDDCRIVFRVDGFEAPG